MQQHFQKIIKFKKVIILKHKLVSKFQIMTLKYTKNSNLNKFINYTLYHIILCL